MNVTDTACLGRCAGVWLLATGVPAGVIGWLLPLLVDARHAVQGHGLSAVTFEDLLVWLCAVVTVCCAGWLWLVTTVVTIEAARGTRARPARGVPAPLRRIVLTACGVALVGGLATPAVAVPGSVHQDRPETGDASVLSGLPLPDRATDGAPLPTAPRPPPAVRRPARPPATDLVVVRPGDTLWDLAASALPAGADDARIARLSQEIWRLNRDVVGADPDLIHPAQRLHVPRA